MLSLIGREKPTLGAATIVALLAAIIIPVLGGWQIILTRQALLLDAGHDARTLCHLLAQHVSRTIEEVDLALSETVGQVEQNDSETRLQSDMRHRTDVLQQLSDIAIVNANGEWTTDTLAAFHPVNSAGRSYFAWHRDHDDRDMFIGDMIIGQATGKPTLTLSRRVNAKDGRFAGVVRAGLKPAFFQSFYDSIEVGPHGTITLWRDTGGLLVRHPAVSGTRERGLPPGSILDLFKQVRSGVQQQPSPIDGVDRMIAFELVERYPLVVSAGIAVKDALAGWLHQAQIEAVVLVLTSAGLISLALGLQRHQRRATLSDLKSRRADAMYRLLADNSSDLIAVKPCDALHRTYVSPSSTAIAGWSPDEFAALHPKEFVHPDDLARVGAEFNSISPERPRLISQHRLRHKAGHDIWVETSSQLTTSDTGVPVIVLTTRDITARWIAEEALKNSEARYRMLAESTSDVITQLDLGLKRHYVSSSCRDLLGYEPEEMLAMMPASNGVHPDDAGEVIAAVNKLVASAVQGGKITVTYRGGHKKGHWVWLENAVTLVCDHRGAPESLICSMRDVTERQRTAEHLEKARAAAENAARLKTEFVANMSHELRTPLTGILGIHDLLEQDPTLGPSQKRYVSIARDAGRSLLAIVNDVLDFSKIEAGELTIERVPFDVAALIESCRHLATDQAGGKPLAIRSTIEEAAITLLGDPGRLKQILLNLITNAVKFTETGTITVAAVYRRELGRLRIDISDTGIGIPPEKISFLFKRFSQADTSTTRKYGGTGLGLAICKRLVELMGGDIGVESVVGCGSTFWIELPLAEVFDDVRQLLDEPSLPILAPCRVLLAEDNVVNQEIISAVLTQWGHVVTIVENGAAATAAVVGASDFDVVLMDVQMPVMDGHSATRAIRVAEANAGRAPIPIIGLTANAMIGDIQRCREAGMDAHVAKPIDWAQLMSAINKLTVLPPKVMVEPA